MKRIFLVLFTLFVFTVPVESHSFTLNDFLSTVERLSASKQREENNQRQIEQQRRKQALREEREREQLRINRERHEMYMERERIRNEAMRRANDLN
jgi:hypothetical protein